MGRILYECMDFADPAGGIRRIYRHVEILNQHGFEAYILHHQPGFVHRWITTAVPVLYWNDKNFAFTDDDILVIPEGHTDIMRNTQTALCRRFGICLGWSRIFVNMHPGETWRSFGIEHAIAGSSYDQLVLRETMGYNASILASGIDTNKFAPAKNKLCQIAYMPQRGSEIAHMIQCMFRTMFSEFSAVPFISIQDLPHSDVAALLSQSAVFLSHTFPEGLSRKALEAMSSACLVVGFSGRGSLEFMRDGHNCYLVEDGDILGATVALGRAVRNIQNDATLDIQSHARETALEYSLSNEDNAVVSFWRNQGVRPIGQK